MTRRGERPSDSSFVRRWPDIDPSFCSLTCLITGRSPQQVRGFHTEGTSEPVDDIDACRIDASLKRADVGAVDPCAMGKLLLRQASRLPKRPQIQRQYLSYFHARESTRL